MQGTRPIQVPPTAHTQRAVRYRVLYLSSTHLRNANKSSAFFRLRGQMLHFFQFSVKSKA